MTVESVSLELKLESGNAAIVDEPRESIAQILRDIARMIENGRDSAAIKDVNGNTIGHFYFEIDGDEDCDDDEDDEEE